MKFFSEMEWNAKWDWDNMVSFNSRASESLKMLQLTDWGIEDQGEIDAGSFDLSGIGGSSGGSGSDLGNDSSVRSSKSASTVSSPKEAVNASSFADLSRTSSPFQPFGTYAEPLIGLRLGKRTYFENTSGSSIKSPSVTVAPVASVAAAKKSKSTSLIGAPPLCQVEGCNLDLSSAKDYHRKHRVCDSHSKCPKVVVKGVERRFCQQCSRFHSLGEFDAKKRSCRRRLADHNSRRRKPRQETIRFNSGRHSSSYYDGTQNVNFSLSTGGSSRNSSWESVSESKFTVTKLPSLIPEKVGQPPLPRFGLPYSIPFQGNSSNEQLTSKGNASDVFKQGFKDSLFSANMDTTPEYPRALSLLSTNSWGSSEPDSISFDQPLHANPVAAMHLSAIPLQFASSEFWPMEHQSSGSLMNSSAQFTGIQLLKSQFHHNIY